MSNNNTDKRQSDVGMAVPGPDTPRRRFLRRVGLGMGAAGGVAMAVPLVGSMTPSDRAKAAGAPVEIDITDLQPGDMAVKAWRGKPVWVLRRTKEMLATLPQADSLISDPASEKSDQPAYAKNEYRSQREEVLVVLGVCTHLGCAPTKAFETGAGSELGDDWIGGFFCPCHGSKFDYAGRVFKNVPAPTNLPIPPYRFADDNTLVIGENPEDVA